MTGGWGFDSFDFYYDYTPDLSFECCQDTSDCTPPSTPSSQSFSGVASLDSANLSPATCNAPGDCMFECAKAYRLAGDPNGLVAVTSASTSASGCTCDSFNLQSASSSRWTYSGSEYDVSVAISGDGLRVEVSYGPALGNLVCQGNYRVDSLDTGSLFLGALSVSGGGKDDDSVIIIVGAVAGLIALGGVIAALVLKNKKKSMERAAAPAPATAAPAPAAAARPVVHSIAMAGPAGATMDEQMLFTSNPIAGGGAAPPPPPPPPPLPPGGLPPGWTMEQWNFYGATYQAP